jgi:4-hydroxythreonine-4-phosphate dehydrogenase
MSQDPVADFPILAVTAGEPAGIGPDVVLQLARASLAARIVIVADADMLTQRAALLGLDVQLRRIAVDVPMHEQGSLFVHHVPLEATVRCGQPDPVNARAVLNALEVAIRACLDRKWDALVTAPMHKGVINDAGIPFSGHTEFLAAATATRTPVMMLVANQLRVALVTTHLALRDVSDAITAARLDDVLAVLWQDLHRRFSIERPRILVCGLNPHAGESGYFGREEIDIIRPAILRARAAGIDVEGPLPADTLFTPGYLDGADAVLAMFHDQGLPVLKYAAFGKAVNVTLGLPIVRTSVDHGTALDIAGSGRADPGSLLAAVSLAAELACVQDR